MGLNWSNQVHNSDRFHFQDHEHLPDPWLISDWPPEAPGYYYGPLRQQEGMCLAW